MPRSPERSRRPVEARINNDVRAAFAIGVSVVASLLLAVLYLRTESGSGISRTARIAVVAVIGLIAGAATTSIGLDLIPDSAEGRLLDLASIILAGLAAVALAVRRLR